MGRWTGGRGRAVWGLGVGQSRLSTVLSSRKSVALATLGAATTWVTSDLSADSFHEPVMVDEVLRFIAPERSGLFLDGTAGGGGHAEAILEAGGDDVRLLALDRDEEALENARSRLGSYGERLLLRQGDYADADSIFGLGEGALAGVLLDLGVSSHQIDSLERGFSFRTGSSLDMRMSGEGTSAADLLATLSVEELTKLFRDFGEVKRARRLASEIATRREQTAGTGATSTASPRAARPSTGTCRATTRIRR